MPHANPETRKLFLRDYLRRYESRLYQASQKHRDEESKRKAEWYALKASDPAWLAMMAARKKEYRDRKKS